MSDFYSSNEVALQPYHVDILNVAKLLVWSKPEIRKELGEKTGKTVPRIPALEPTKPPEELLQEQLESKKSKKFQERVQNETVPGPKPDGPQVRCGDQPGLS